MQPYPRLSQAAQAIFCLLVALLAVQACPNNDDSASSSSSSSNSHPPTKHKSHDSVKSPKPNKHPGSQSPPVSKQPGSNSPAVKTQPDSNLPSCKICIAGDVCNFDDYPNSRKFFHIINTTTYCDQKEGKLNLAHWRLYFNEKTVVIETITQSSPVNYYVRYEPVVDGKVVKKEVVYMVRPDDTYVRTGRRGCTFSLPEGVTRHDVNYVEAMWSLGGQPNYID
jgi:hypothetical protein